jgi:S-(hydroxymethyl)glutathione dehydrogenase / alcohol dehydrogenase
MKAAILVKSKLPLEVADIKLPDNLDYGQVLVRIFYSGICGAQINEIEGVKGVDNFLPHLLGHEGGGIVEKVGSGVSVVKKGDRVVLHWMKGDGIQSVTPKYKWGSKIVNAGWVTTFNEYAVVSENRVTPIPDSFDLKLASLFGCAVTTAFGVIHNDSKLKSGESLVVFGAGGVGSAIIKAGSFIGANPIIAIDVNDYKLTMAKKFGATYIYNGKKVNINKKILSIVGEKGADVIVDTTGINSIRETAYELTSPQGRTILVGVPRKEDKMSIDSFPLHFDKILTGSHGGNTNPSYDIPRLVRLVEAGKLKLDDLITKTYKLDKINQAIDEVRSGDVIRSVIEI